MHVSNKKCIFTSNTLIIKMLKNISTNDIKKDNKTVKVVKKARNMAILGNLDVKKTTQTK